MHYDFRPKDPKTLLFFICFFLMNLSPFPLYICFGGPDDHWFSSRYTITLIFSIVVLFVSLTNEVTGLLAELLYRPQAD